MSSEKEWKTVNNAKKSASIAKVSSTKTEKKKVNMPRINPTGGLKQTKTIYERFMLKNERINKKLEDRSSEDNPADVVRRINKRLLNLHDAIEGLDVEEMTDIVSKGDIGSNELTSGGLKDLSTFINQQLPNPSGSDAILSNKPYNFPLCECEKEKESWLTTCFMKQRSDVVVMDCLDYCLNALVSAKEDISIGYRLIIQIILKKRPQLITSRIQKYDLLLQKYSGKPMKSMSLLWSFAQAGYTSLSNALNVWFGLMFGQINVKSANNFVLDFLENSVGMHKNVSQGNVSKTDYFKFFSEAFSTQSLLSDSLKSRLRHLHPIIKQVAWRDADLSSFFIGYLSRCQSNCPQDKKTKLLEMATECLLKDAACFEAWNSKLSKYTNQSVVLLEDILNGAHRGKLVGSERRCTGVHCLLPTLRNMKTGINMEDEEEKMAGVESCIQLIQTMKSRSSKKGYFIFFSFLIPFLILAVGFCCLDSQQEKRMYKQLGKVKDQIVQTSSEHYKWLVTDDHYNVIKGVYSKASISSKWIKEHSVQAVKYLNDQLPWLFESLSKITEAILQLFTSNREEWMGILSNATDTVKTNSLNLCNYINTNSQHVFNYINTNSQHVFNYINKNYQPLLNNIKTNTQYWFNNINNYTQNLINNIKISLSN